MKMLFVMAVALTSLSLEARSVRTFEDFYFSNVFQNNQPTSLVGTARISAVTKTIQVKIYHDPCGQFQPARDQVTCRALATLVREFVAPIKSLERPCNSRILVALDDQRPVDGPMTRIELADHSQRTCLDLLAQLNEVKVDFVQSGFSPQGPQTETFYLTNQNSK